MVEFEMGFRTVMWTVFLIVKVNFVSSIYFTISDVNLTIPKALSDPSVSYNIREFPIMELNARNTMDAIARTSYSLNATGGYLYINEKTGKVFLTPAFLRNIEEISQMDIVANVLDLKSGDSDRTSLRLTVFPQDRLECGEFAKEMCFWSGAVYRVERRSRAAVMGPLTSPLLRGVCPHRVSYSLLTDVDYLKIVPPNEKIPFWSLRSTNNPFAAAKKSKISVRVLCTLENTSGEEKGTIRKIEANLTVLLLNINEFVPTPQYPEMNITLSETVFREGYNLDDPRLLFTDPDIPEVNHYEADIIRYDERDFLEPNCTKYLRPYTAIHCSLRFKKDVSFREPTYSFKIQLKDTALKNKNATNTAQFPITFVFKAPPQSLTMLRLYPKTIVKIFNTASPLARVTQPLDVRNCSDFSMTETLLVPEKRQIFNVTVDEGIVFVHDFLVLRKVSTDYVNINVSWTRNNRREYDEIQVRIVNEPNRTCTNIKSGKGWTTCAEFETSHDCQKRDSCGYGTGGSSSVESRRGPERCMWRGDDTSPNITHLYSTCSPDIHTCPDGVCDSLEQLHHLICPQDCTEEVVVPLKLNPVTGRGVDESSGTVACSPKSCYSFQSRKSNNADKDSRRKKKKISVVHSNVTSEHNITTGEYNSMTEKCGPNCMMGIGAGAVLLIVSIAFFVLCWRLDRTRKTMREKFEDNHREMTTPLSISGPGATPHDPFSLNFNMTTLMNDPLIFNNMMKCSPDPKWEFPRSQLAIEQILGEGEFGRVLRARASNISGLTGYTTVAVKTLKDDARESELNDLLMEYQLLKEVSHPNVIRLLGVCTEPGGPIYLIIEYCEHGSLRNYLRKSRKLQYESNKLINMNETDYDEPKTSDITPKDLLSFAWQICNGMSYLSDIKLVHRDLAARNVLLAADKICKVSDFGLTRDVYEDNAYLKRSKGRVPVKWMAPESLADHIYTSKSDVWSFGILVWELITLGSNPYPGIVVQNLYHLLRQGYRMERPNNCSPALYNIMRKCWNLNPQQRPSFQELSKRFEKLLEDNIEYINLSDNVIHNRGYFLSPFEEDDAHEKMDEEFSSEISSLNYLSKTNSCEKMMAIEKALNEDLEKMIDVAKPNQSYESPVKVPRRVKTPSNENPEEYTDMGRKA